MVFALIPKPVHESQEKLEKFLGLISDIADVTYAHEPENRTYCWFRKSPLDQRDGFRCCGFEVYANEQALTQTHRASPEYKKMRSAGADENLFLRPTDLIFLEPACESGYITKEGHDVRFCSAEARDTLIVVRIYSTKNMEATQMLLAQLNALAQRANEDGILTYMPFKRRDSVDTEVSVLERYSSKAAFEQAEKSLHELSIKARAAAEHVDVSIWENGIGHIRSPGSNQAP